MSYFKVPLGKSSKVGGKGRSTQVSLTALITRAIDYVMYKVWVMHYEKGASKRSFSVLRQ